MRVVLGFILLVGWLSLASTASAGEIHGEVTLVTSKVPDRAKNTNPNRNATVKKYGLKELKKAQAGGDGGPASNESKDERDFTLLFLTAQKDGAKLSATPRVVEISQQQRRFYDHITAMPLGSKVRFTNKDQFYHHIYCPDSSKLSVPEHRGDVERKPDRVGKYELFCDIHPLMNAYLYVTPNDKFVVAKGGKFTLTGVPAGNYVLQAWHPRLTGKTYEVVVPANGAASKVHVKL